MWTTIFLENYLPHRLNLYRLNWLILMNLTKLYNLQQTQKSLVAMQRLFQQRQQGTAQYTEQIGSKVQKME